MADDDVGAGRLGLAERRQQILDRDVDALAEHRGDAELGEGLGEILQPALAVGVALIDDRRMRLAERLDDVARMRDLDDVVAGEEAEDPLIAELGDPRRARDGDQRHLALGGDRQHRQHLRAEHRGDDGDRLGLQRLLQRVDGDLRRGAGIGDVMADRQAARPLLEGEQRAVALALPLEREEAGERHENRDGELRGTRPKWRDE